MSEVRIGIIGVGNIGSAHAYTIYKGRVEGLRLVALCDTDPKKMIALTQAYNDVTVYDNADALIADENVDAVIISTPHYDHPVIAEKAFKAGKHVLSEKPIGVYGVAARRMCNAAKQSGKVFAVMFNQRTNKLYSHAHELVRSGALGELKRSVWIVTNWYRKQCYYESGEWRATWSGEGGGVLMNQAPHNLDLWQWICGMPVEISAHCDESKYHNIEVEDDATIFAKYANGATGVFITSTGEHPGTNRLEISGTKGKLVIENGTLTLTTLATDEREYVLSEKEEKNPTTVTTLSDEPYNGHMNILKNFADAILYGKPLIARGEEGLSQLSICNAAYLSAWTEKPVFLPLDDDEYLKLLNKKRDASKRGKTIVAETPSVEYKDRWNTNW